MADARISPEEEEEFFDSREDIWVVPNSCPGSPGNQDSCLTDNFISCLWSGRLSSVQERRYKFMKWMDLDLGHGPHQGPVHLDGELEMGGEISPDIESVLMFSGDEDGPSMPGCSSEEGGLPEGNIECRVTNLNDGIVSIVDEMCDGSLRSLNKACSRQMVAVDEFERGFSPSSIQHVVLRKDSISNNSGKTTRRRGIGWLRKLGIAACIVDRQWEECNSTILDSDCSGGARVQRVRVHPYKKRFKEFSAVYMEQDIKAHDSAILTMKFSPDGLYLASGGEDGVVCIWGVMACARIDEDDIPMDDPLCVYFKMNNNYKLTSLCTNEERKDKLRTSDSICVIIPPDNFRLSEKPLHVFRGHDGNVLDLSWSKNKYLLSSSMDKTVRLWQVGCDSCLKIFSHNNYVTCVQFNPVEEKYFISGSIDGKIRIWETHECKVVDWIDTREIVTAICYRPDGKGAVVGFMSGDCHFYDATGNHLQLDAQISLQGKRKSPYKRITGFQFSPNDDRKLMVTCADSQIRILYGVYVICKYRGIRNAGSQISASFTSDGRHIVSASEDSYVYVWSHTDQYPPTSKKVKMKNTWSSECFFSSYVSVAIPWHGSDSKNPVTVISEIPRLDSIEKSHADSLGSNTSGDFIPSRDFFSELLPKGSATWPEEKLPMSSMTPTALCKSHCKFLKTSCQNTPHAWGKVVVTAGWDGRIRSFRNYGYPVHI